MKLPDDRPTVVFVSIPTGIGGSTRSLANLLEGIEGRLFRVLAGPPDGRFVQFVHDEGVVDAHLPIVSRRWPRPLQRMWTAIRLAAFTVRHRRSITAIHANGLKELSLSVPAALLSRRPLVVWIHNFALPPSIRFFGWLWRLLLPRIDVRWSAVSPLACSLATDVGLTTPEAVTIVPNPIDPAEIVTSQRVPAARPRAAYLGAPRGYKGFAFVPDIVERTRDAVDWLIFSNQTDEDLADAWDRLRAMAAASDAHGRVEVVGKLIDVSEAYGRCDIVLCPSILESWCRVAAEAMLNGLPVVGSDLEPIRALLGDDEAGLLHPVGDIDAAVAAIERLAADPALRSRLGAAGRERAAAFAPAAICTQLLSLYGLSPLAPAV